MAAIRSFRFTVPDSVNSIAVPNLKRASIEKSFIVKNTSALTSLRISFPGDGATDYWTIPAGSQSPEFHGLRGGDLITTDGVGGSVSVEVVIWEGN